MDQDFHGNLARLKGVATTPAALSVDFRENRYDTPTTEGAVFERFSDIHLPRGGYVVTLAEAFLDESGTHAGSPALVVAGYLIERSNSEAMAKAWNEVLTRYQLSYFHMVECAHGNGEFAKLNMTDRIAVQTQMIAIIKQFTVQGIGVIISYADFTKRFGEKCFYGTAYTFAMHVIWRGIALWAEKTDFQRQIAYFFEAGHKSAGEAHQLMSLAISAPEIRNQMHYAGLRPRPRWQFRQVPKCIFASGLTGSNITK
jgi:hypothetical protein